jgi:hypothetical protein
MISIGATSKPEPALGVRRAGGGFDGANLFLQLDQLLCRREFVRLLRAAATLLRRQLLRHFYRTPRGCFGATAISSRSLMQAGSNSRPVSRSSRVSADFSGRPKSLPSASTTVVWNRFYCWGVALLGVTSRKGPLRTLAAMHKSRPFPPRQRCQLHLAMQRESIDGLHRQTAPPALLLSQLQDCGH